MTQNIDEQIEAAASAITDLWWAKPEENGHIKAKVVAEIIRRHMAGKRDSQPLA